MSPQTTESALELLAKLDARLNNYFGKYRPGERFSTGLGPIYETAGEFLGDGYSERSSDRGEFHS